MRNPISLHAYRSAWALVIKIARTNVSHCDLLTMRSNTYYRKLVYDAQTETTRSRELAAREAPPQRWGAAGRPKRGGALAVR